MDYLLQLKVGFPRAPGFEAVRLKQQPGRPDMAGPSRNCRDEQAARPKYSSSRSSGSLNPIPKGSVLLPFVDPATPSQHRGVADCVGTAMLQVPPSWTNLNTASSSVMTTGNVLAGHEDQLARLTIPVSGEQLAAPDPSDCRVNEMPRV